MLPEPSLVSCRGGTSGGAASTSGMFIAWRLRMTVSVTVPPTGCVAIR